MAEKNGGNGGSDGGPQRNGNAGRPGRAGRTEREVFVISVAAEITGMHAQTLRTYDRMGLVSPERTRGGGRRYSQDDIEQLQMIQRLSHDEGVNLAGIKAIIELQNRVRDLEDEAAGLRHRLADAEQRADAAGAGAGMSRRHGEIVHVPRSTAVVLWEQRRRSRGDSGNPGGSGGSGRSHGSDGSNGSNGSNDDGGPGRSGRPRA
jgi:MerR family transcriptional regulator/heat shock protein HspR